MVLILRGAMFNDRGTLSIGQAEDIPKISLLAAFRVRVQRGRLVSTHHISQGLAKMINVNVILVRLNHSDYLDQSFACAMVHRIP